MGDVEGRTFDTALNAGERGELLAKLDPNHTTTYVKFSLALVWCCVGVGLGLWEHDITGAVMCGLWIAGFIAVAVVFARYVRWRSALLAGTGPQSVTLGADGIRAGATVVPWNRIHSAVDIGGTIALVRDGAPPFAIPKRSLVDDGAALWAYLDARLTGRGMLVRSTRTRRVIYNTAR